ncbi:MAG: hypothetical protein ACXVJE_19515 [Mucilaginibacter sp.]
MATKHHNKGTAKLKKIIHDAKEIYKKHPTRKWTAIVKEVAAKHRKK